MLLDRKRAEKWCQRSFRPGAIRVCTDSGRSERARSEDWPRRLSALAMDHCRVNLLSHDPPPSNPLLPTDLRRRLSASSARVFCGYSSCSSVMLVPANDLRSLRISYITANRRKTTARIPDPLSPPVQQNVQVRDALRSPCHRPLPGSRPGPHLGTVRWYWLE